jgi:hypothetical protein
MSTCNVAFDDSEGVTSDSSNLYDLSFEPTGGNVASHCTLI